MTRTAELIEASCKSSNGRPSADELSQTYSSADEAYLIDSRKSTTLRSTPRLAAAE